MLLAATRPEVRTGSAHLVASEHASASDAALTNNLRATINELLAGENVSTWRIADSTGRIVLAAEPEFAGQRIMTDLLDATSRAIDDNKIQFVPPSLMNGNTLPQMGFIAPISTTADSKPIGVLVVRIDPRGSFSELFKAGQLGTTGETYAFDQQGRMISESRFLEQLKSANPALAKATTSVFIVNLRDYSNAAPGMPAAALPLTKMAAAAIAGKAGSN